MTQDCWVKCVNNVEKLSQDVTVEWEGHFLHVLQGCPAVRHGLQNMRQTKNLKHCLTG